MPRICMDLLSQYKQQSPAQFQESGQADRQLRNENGFFLRLVISLSGGRVRDAEQASVILLVAVIVLIAGAAVIAWPRGSQRTPTSAEIKEMMRKMGNFPAGNSSGGL